MKAAIFLMLIMSYVKAMTQEKISFSPSGWKSCDANTKKFDESEFDDPNVLAQRKQGAALPAECQRFTAPLCYPGICDSNTTITLFVKRIVSSSASKAIWVMDGGPGAASVDMEFFMQDTYVDMNGAFSVYTMDHRGTGRSNKLECSGDASDVNNTAECVNHLNQRYGDNAAGFSITSAAMDIVTLTSLIDSKADWYVYGVSYGTYLMERVMHLQDKFTYKGYILDSVVPETMNVSDGDAAYGAIADRILKLIDVQEKTTTPLRDQLEAFYKEIDSNANHKCGAWVRDVVGVDDKDPPSYAARWLFGMLFGSGELRGVFYTLFTIMRRCSIDDTVILQAVRKYVKDIGLFDANITSDYDSLILYYVILSSEHQLFYTPAPTLSILKAYFLDQIAGDPIYRDF
ncbi:serine protease family S33, partial [Thraustotheca clavata]